MRQYDSQSSVLLRVAAVWSLLIVLFAGQIAVLYATLYHFTIDTAGAFSSPVWYPPLWFIVVVGAGAVIVLRRASRDDWADIPATLTASGLVLLGFATLSTMGLCETSSIAAVGRPLASLSIEWRARWLVGPATPAIEASSPGGSCQAYLRAIPLLFGYLFIGAGLFLHGWLDARLAVVASTVETRIGTGH